MGLDACSEQIAQGVLSTEPGAHERQISDSQARIRRNLVFVPVVRYLFFAHNFSRADLAGAHKWNMQ